MQKGMKPFARLRSISSCKDEGFILPFWSQETLITFWWPIPTTFADIKTE